VPNAGEPFLRIGELARRLGLSQDVLRAWERRYGLLKPVRSPGGFRLYTSADEQRVRRMRSYLADGLATAEAARATLAEQDEQPAEEPPVPPTEVDEAAPQAGVTPPAPSHTLPNLAAELRRTLDAFDEPAAEAVLDRLFTEFTVETTLREVLLPYLRELGARWAQDEAGVDVEHFASNLLRARLASLARGWGGGRGPRAVLACPPGELHDLPLLAFGVVLHRSGWRVVYLGADTPLPDLRHTVAEVHPDAVVLSTVDVERFQHVMTDLIALSRDAPLRLAGAGATPAVADAAGATVLAGDPVTEALQLAPPVRPSSLA
jgi:MerR family transcriptional regulator, light-induced transcriptional regulator